MPFKYKAQLSAAAAPCPAANASPLNKPIIAFRLVSNMPAVAGDFVPPGMMNRGAHRGRPQPCESFALSYFSTQQQAEDHYCRLKAKLAKQHREIRLGPYVVSSTIDPAHGLCTPVRPSDGHFDLHEYASAAMEKVSVIITKVQCG